MTDPVRGNPQTAHASRRTALPIAICYAHLLMANTSDIAAQHRVVLVAIRLIAVLVMWAGLFPAVVAVAIAIAERDFTDEDQLIPFILGVGITGVSFLFWKAAPWFARKAIPNPLRVLCPCCGFDLEGAVSEQCNECGLPLSEEFRRGTVLQGPAQNPPAKLFALQGTMTAVARLLAAIMMLPSLMYALGFLVAAVNAFNRRHANLAEAGTLFTMACLAVAAGGLCLLPWLLPRWTGRQLAPAVRLDSGELQPVRHAAITGIARLLACIVVFPSVGVAVGFAIGFIADATSTYPSEEFLAFSLGMAAVGTLGIGLCALPWLFPMSTGRVLMAMPKPESTPETEAAPMAESTSKSEEA